MAKSHTNFIGSWAFLVGVVLAVILGLIVNFSGPGSSPSEIWTIVLVIIGLLVGLLNVEDKETMPFLMSGTVLIIASALGGSVLWNIQIITSVLNALLLIFLPATVIVAIKNVFNLARN